MQYPHCPWKLFYIPSKILVIKHLLTIVQCTLVVHPSALEIIMSFCVWPESVTFGFILKEFLIFLNGKKKKVKVFQMKCIPEGWSKTVCYCKFSNLLYSSYFSFKPVTNVSWCFKFPFAIWAVKNNEFENSVIS